MKLSLVIPAYNEENRIGKTIKAFLSYFKNNKEEEKFDYIKDGIKMGLDLLKLRFGR
jgi:glycosyltransferase involved in cell wall biosynthesis